jgi:hypothetical protein
MSARIMTVIVAAIANSAMSAMIVAVMNGNPGSKKWRALLLDSSSAAARTQALDAPQAANFEIHESRAINR